MWQERPQGRLPLSLCDTGRGTCATVAALEASRGQGRGEGVLFSGLVFTWGGNALTEVHGDGDTPQSL